MAETPNPGSSEALDLGCACAVLDNNRGRSAPWSPDGWWITAGCPVHAPEAASPVAAEPAEPEMPGQLPLPGTEP